MIFATRGPPGGVGNNASQRKAITQLFRALKPTNFLISQHCILKVMKFRTFAKTNGSVCLIKKSASRNHKSALFSHFPRCFFFTPPRAEGVVTIVYFFFQTGTSTCVVFLPLVMTNYFLLHVRKSRALRNIVGLLVREHSAYEHVI